MKTIKINGKIMEEKLKRGWTASRFAERFQVSEEEFLETLQKNFSKKAYSGMINRLRKNEKRFNKDAVVPGEDESRDSIAIEVPSTSSDDSNEDNPLKLLKMQKENLVNFLNEKELKHKDLVEERLSIRKSISKYENKLLKLKSQISEYRTEVEALLIQHEDVYIQMKSVNSEISETKKAIDNLDKEIEAMSKITLYVYKSGEFEFDSSVKIDISGWKTFYDTLITNDKLECLTVKEIKTLAKCFAYVDFFKSQNISYEIIFENEVVENCFRNIN